MTEKEIVIRIRAIAKCEIKGKKYEAGIFIKGLTDKQIEEGLADGYLAEVQFIKVGKKLKRR